MGPEHGQDSPISEELLAERKQESLQLRAESLAAKRYSELDGQDFASISMANPDELRYYAGTVAGAGNSEILAALGVASFMQFRVPQSRGIIIPDEESRAYEEVAMYIDELARRLSQSHNPQR